MSDDALAFADAVSLGQRIAKRTVSSLELTQLYLARLEKYGATYGAVVTIMHERALREARAADKELASGNARSPLHGVPYGVKDLLAAIGAPGVPPPSAASSKPAARASCNRKTIASAGISSTARLR